MMNPTIKSIAWWLDLPLRPLPVRRSKHSAAPFTGKAKIAHDSGLRKLMRAARRGTLTAWQRQSIKLAMKSSNKLNEGTT